MFKLYFHPINTLNTFFYETSSCSYEIREFRKSLAIELSFVIVQKIVRMRINC